jgi:hypothetical protein
MPLTHRRDERDIDPRDERSAAEMDERTSVTAHEGWNATVRVVAVVAAAAATLLGVVALVRIDWTDGLNSAPADVLGMPFTPWVAIVTAVAGLIALAAAASPDRGSKLAVGGILIVAGLAILLIGDGDRADLDVERAHGWLALGVGAIVVLAGLLLRTSVTTHRQVTRETV